MHLSPAPEMKKIKIVLKTANHLRCLVTFPKGDEYGNCKTTPANNFFVPLADGALASWNLSRPDAWGPENSVQTRSTRLPLHPRNSSG